MKETTEVSCSCYGPFTFHQEKLFLTRKRDHDQQEPPFSLRRINKSAELKTDSEGKPLKKSLKKRPGSALGADSQLPNTPIDCLKPQCEPKAKLAEQLQVRNNQRAWHKGHQTPLHVQFNPQSQINQMRFPQTTTSTRVMPFLHQAPDQTHFQNPFPQPHGPYQPKPIHQEKTVTQLRPQLQHFKNETALLLNASPSFSRDGKGQMMTDLKGKQVMSKQTLVPHDIYYSTQLQPPSFKEPKQSNETWNIDEENLVIQGFERLFKPREENKSHDNLGQNKHRHQHPREAQQSKRLQKQQQLFGRFAQSDDGQSDSESPPSEVIGRGFDRTYQDLLDFDHETYHQETKASRSTNTKMSELHMGQRRVSEHQTPSVFGTTNHFKSYKYL